MAWFLPLMLLLSIPRVSCSRVRVARCREHEGSKHLDIRPSESAMLATDPASVCPCVSGLGMRFAMPAKAAR